MTFCEITVLFDPPFWVAVFERYENDSYSIARIVIDTVEPEGVQLKMFFNKLDVYSLSYTKAVKIDKVRKGNLSFKKQQKRIKQATSSLKYKHTYNKAQTMLKEQRNDNKTEKQKNLKVFNEETHNRKFQLKQIKKREKHRGH